MFTSINWYVNKIKTQTYSPGGVSLEIAGAAVEIMILGVGSVEGLPSDAEISLLLILDAVRDVTLVDHALHFRNYVTQT